MEWVSRVERAFESRKKELDTFLEAHDFEVEQKLNSSQRIILIAESYDFEILKTAEWLRAYGVEITCYEIALAKGTDTEYLSAIQVFPLKQLEDNVRKQSQINAERRANKPTIYEKLKICANKTVTDFVTPRLQEGSMNASKSTLMWPPTGKARFKLSVIANGAKVRQLGRFQGDVAQWGRLSAPPRILANGDLRLYLTSDSDVALYASFVDCDLNAVEWISTTEDDLEEE